MEYKYSWLEIIVQRRYNGCTTRARLSNFCGNSFTERGLVMAVINREVALSTGKRFASQIRAEIDSKALVLLFGSCAKNEINEKSDIDIAVVSETFDNNMPENFAKLTVIAYGINVEIEPHPFTPESWNDITPFISEIKKTGVVL
jgi:predicted nucleotidyltransferase